MPTRLKRKETDYTTTWGRGTVAGIMGAAAQLGVLPDVEPDEPAFAELIMNLAVLTHCWNISMKQPLFFKVLISHTEPATLSQSFTEKLHLDPGGNEKGKEHSRGQCCDVTCPTDQSSVYRTESKFKSKLFPFQRGPSAYRM